MLALGHQFVDKWMKNENDNLSSLIMCSILNCSCWIIQQKDIGYETNFSNSKCQNAGTMIILNFRVFVDYFPLQLFTRGIIPVKTVNAYRDPT